MRKSGALAHQVKEQNTGAIEVQVEVLSLNPVMGCCVAQSLIGVGWMEFFGIW